MTNQPDAIAPSDPHAWVYGWEAMAEDPNYPLTEPAESAAEAEARRAGDIARTAEGEAGYHAYAAETIWSERGWGTGEADATAVRTDSTARAARAEADKALEAVQAERHDAEAGS